MDNQIPRGRRRKQGHNWTHAKQRRSSSSMALKGKLLKLLKEKIVIVKSIMKDLPLDSIPKTMVAQDIVQESMYTIRKEAKEKTITNTNVEDEDSDEKKDNLVLTNDDNNIHVNILDLCFSHWQTKLSLAIIFSFFLKLEKFTQSLTLRGSNFDFSSQHFYPCCI